MLLASAAGAMGVFSCYHGNRQTQPLMRCLMGQAIQYHVCQAGCGTMMLYIRHLLTGDLLADL